MGAVVVAFAPLVVAACLIDRPAAGPGICHPGSDGFVACQLQESWLPWLSLVVLIGAAAHVARQLAVGALHAVPAVVRRHRAGERLRFGRPPSVRSWHTDPRLAAAVWAPVTTPREHARAFDACAEPAPAPRPHLSVCGRCSATHVSTSWRSRCPGCGGVALAALTPPASVLLQRPRPITTTMERLHDHR